MSDKVYSPRVDFVTGAHVDAAKYEAMYAASVTDPDAFWREHGKRLDWIRPYTKVKNTSVAPGNIDIRWLKTAR